MRVGAFTPAIGLTTTTRTHKTAGHYDYNPNVNCGQGMIWVYDGYHCGSGF